MSRKSKIEITAEIVSKAIEDGKLTSMTQLAHEFGYKGSVSSSLTKKFRQLAPDVDALLAANKLTGGNTGKVSPTRKPPKPKSSSKSAKAKAKFPHCPSNPFKRSGSAYGLCFDILAAHKDGLPRQKLVELLAKATGKDLIKAAFDVQVICSARGEAGANLNPFEGPRNRSAHFGYWVKRDNSHVQLMLPADAKMETP
ncbi:MAG: hypothetical protein WCI88_09810 [Chloroflexota bacterium]